ncbi:hypothetical protein [Niabella yanshanensis]|uniref:hypothetical protein n=1 Tax=Niabella yanshanensis TaxID=577386 RepID=UPI001B876C40|nr:hypothetical protein [Niabella yanshanensis]
MKRNEKEPGRQRIFQPLYSGKSIAEPSKLANLVEWPAVDQRMLLQYLLMENKQLSYLAPIVKAIDQLKKQTVNTINEVIGNGILEKCQKKSDHEFFPTIATHKADVVRCWATYTIGHNAALPLKSNSDPSRYVLDSVGNWLNDASKSKPDLYSNFVSAGKKRAPTRQRHTLLRKPSRPLINNDPSSSHLETPEKGIKFF